MAPCRCTIEALTKAMKPEEFMELSKSGAIMRDARYINARQSCATAPKQQ